MNEEFKEELKVKINTAIMACARHEFETVSSRLNFLSGYLESYSKEISDLLDYCYSNLSPVLF